MHYRFGDQNILPNTLKAAFFDFWTHSHPEMNSVDSQKIGVDQLWNSADGFLVSESALKTVKLLKQRLISQTSTRANIPKLR